MRRAKEVLVALVATVVAVVVVEVAVRYLRPRRLPRLVPHAVLNHVWRPDTNVVYDEWRSAGIAPYPRRYNHESWPQQRDVSEAKPAGSFRVFYVGDSFTEGIGPEETTIPGRVQALLAADFREHGLDLEVVNTGTASYSPVIYHILVSRYLLRYAPDLIVINVDMTDVFDDFLYRDTAVAGADGTPGACPPGSRFKGRYVRSPDGLREQSAGERAIEWARERSRLVDLGCVAVMKLRGGPPAGTGAGASTSIPPNPDLPRLFDWCGAVWSPETETLVSQSMATLRATLRAARSANVRIGVTAVPHLGHFTGRYSSRPFEEVAAACRAEGVPYLDSFQAIREALGARDPAELYIPGDMHFNERGNALWAPAQAAFVRRLAGL
jgi:lysophospholipase L1-like esterase